jgi:hypothetical protein
MTGSLLKAGQWLMPSHRDTVASSTKPRCLRLGYLLIDYSTSPGPMRARHVALAGSPARAPTAIENDDLHRTPGSPDHPGGANRTLYTSHIRVCGHTSPPYLIPLLCPHTHRHGKANVTRPNTTLSGCMLALFRSVSKNLKSLSKRLVAPTVMNPYRFGSL